MKTYSVSEIRILIMDYRLEKGLSIIGLSRLTNITKQTIHNIMNESRAYVHPTVLNKLREHNIIE